MTNPKQELSEYMGNSYQAHKLVWTPEKERDVMGRFKTRRAFDDDKEALYCYTRREVADEWWRPHKQFVAEVRGQVGGEVLDIHSATGWLSLDYADAFMDYQTRSIEFLKWRLKQRQDSRPVYDFGDEPPYYDLVTYMDVRQNDINTTVNLGGNVALGLDSRLVDAPALLEWIRGTFQVIAYRIVNHYVHLIAFATGAEAPSLTED